MKKHAASAFTIINPTFLNYSRSSWTPKCANNCGRYENIPSWRFTTRENQQTAIFGCVGVWRGKNTRRNKARHLRAPTFGKLWSCRNTKFRKSCRKSMSENWKGNFYVSTEACTSSVDGTARRISLQVTRPHTKAMGWRWGAGWWKREKLKRLEWTRNLLFTFLRGSVDVNFKLFVQRNGAGWRQWCDENVKKGLTQELCARFMYYWKLFGLMPVGLARQCTTRVAKWILTGGWSSQWTNNYCASRTSEIDSSLAWFCVAMSKSL